MYDANGLVSLSKCLAVGCGWTRPEWLSRLHIDDRIGASLTELETTNRLPIDPLKLCE